MNSKSLYKLLVNILSIIIAISVLFSLASNVYGIGQGQDDDVDTEIYGEDTEQSGAPEDPSTEEVEGKTMKIYTIEDLFFNRIPLLDANFFTETAGGKPIQEGSAISIIRKVVKNWYISFRNVAIVVIAIIIVFAGVRIAISTIAEDKANYKNILVNWVKALLIVLTMHFCMYAIQYLNAKLLEVLQTSLENKYGAAIDPTTGQPMSNTGQVYNTIVKRAFDVRYKIGIPGAIMYLVLTIYFLRFCFVYVRRYAGLIILTILAPLVAIKNAILSLNGKSSSEFARWLGDYTTTTFIQSIHALVFLTLITTAIDLALVNIGGFIVALLMLHAVTKITALATQIFNFNSSGGGGNSFATELLTPGADSSPILSSSTYLSVKTWQSIGQSFKGLKNTAVRTKEHLKDSKLVKGVKDVTGITAHQKKKEERIKANSGEELESTYNEDGTVNVAQTRRVLKGSKRRNNSQGKAARTIIKGLKNYQGKKMFYGGVKQALAIAGGFMAIPLAVTSDAQYEVGHQNLGQLLGVASADLFIKGGNDVIDGAKNQTKKKKDKYNKVMNNVVVGNRIMDMLDGEFDSMVGDEAFDGRDALRKLNKFNVNTYSLKDTIRISLSLHNIKELKPTNVDFIVNDVMKRSKINIRVEDPEQREIYKSIIRDTLLENSEAINESIRNGSIYDDEIGDSDVIGNARERARNGFAGVVASVGSGHAEPGSPEGPIEPSGDSGVTGPSGGSGPIGPSGEGGAIGPAGGETATGPEGAGGALGPGETGVDGALPFGEKGEANKFGSRAEQEKLDHDTKLLKAQMDHVDVERRRLQGRKTELENKIKQLGTANEKDKKELETLTKDIEKLDTEKSTIAKKLNSLTKKFETRKTSEELRALHGKKEQTKGFTGLNGDAKSPLDQKELGPEMVEPIMGYKGNNGSLGFSGKSGDTGKSVETAKATQETLNRRFEAAKRTQTSMDPDIDAVLNDTERKMNELQARIAEVDRLSKMDPSQVNQNDIERQLEAINRLEETINNTLGNQPIPEPTSTSDSSGIDIASTAHRASTVGSTARAATPSNDVRTRSRDSRFVDLSQVLSDRLTGQIMHDVARGSKDYTSQAVKFNTLRDINQLSGKQGVAPYSLNLFISELK